MIITTPMILLGFHLSLAIICYAFLREDKRFTVGTALILAAFIVNVFTAFILFLLIVGGTL